MREILFRGKRHNGEWYYGSYLFLNVPSYDWKGDARGKAEPVHYIINEKDINYAVDPSTVGQFTGLTDKNRKKIFEGDIIKHYNRDDNPAAFDVGMIFWDTKKCRWLRTAQKCNYNPEVWSSCAKNYVVIGNIHDNPELLEVE